MKNNECHLLQGNIKQKMCQCNGKENEHSFINARIHGARVSGQVKSHARDFPVLKLSGRFFEPSLLNPEGSKCSFDDVIGLEMSRKSTRLTCSHINLI